MSYSYEYPRAALTVDCVVFGRDPAGLRVLLIKRSGEPFAGHWALPGGYLELDETLEHAVTLRIDPRETFCSRPRLPRVRAIKRSVWRSWYWLNAPALAYSSPAISECSCAAAA